MGFLADKRILITGVLSKHSIAYGIAKACHREGAQLAFTYQNERFQDRVGKFAKEFDSTLIYKCDVAEDAEIEEVAPRELGTGDQDGDDTAEAVTEPELDTDGDPDF